MRNIICQGTQNCLRRDQHIGKTLQLVGFFNVTGQEPLGIKDRNPKTERSHSIITLGCYISETQTEENESCITQSKRHTKITTYNKNKPTWC